MNQDPIPNDPSMIGTKRWGAPATERTPATRKAFKQRTKIAIIIGAIAAIGAVSAPFTGAVPAAPTITSIQ